MSRLLAAAAGLLAAGGLAACAGGGGHGGSAELVTPADFAKADDGAADDAVGESGRRVVTLNEREAGADVAATRPRPRVMRRITAEEARAGVVGAVVTVGPPSEGAALRNTGATRGRPSLSTRSGPNGAAEGSSSAGGDRAGGTDDGEAGSGPVRVILVDKMVGQINGDPIYAAQFFEELDARFRAEAQRMRPEEWLAFAQDEIARTLIGRIRDQLLLAEFYARLTEQQRQGILFFLEQMRGDVIAEAAGSAALADERARREEGLSLEQSVQRDLDKQLIVDVFRREVARGINVSWRDIERYYYENEERFVTPGRASLRLIRVPLGEKSELEAVEAAIAAGEPFEEIARNHSTFRSSAGGGLIVDLGDQAYTDVPVIALEEVNAAAHGLAEGEASPRIDAGRNAWWVKLEALREMEVRSLFEAQNEIQAAVYERRLREAELDYFGRLFNKASLDDIDLMQRRLLEFAAQRYLGEALAREGETLDAAIDDAIGEEDRPTGPIGPDGFGAGG